MAAYSHNAPSWCFRLGDREFRIKESPVHREFPQRCLCRKEGILSDDRSFITATYTDLSQADGANSTIRRLYAEFGVPLELDAVIVGHKASGEARFYSSDRDGARPDADEPATWSLSAGLAAALFPSVAADVPRSLRVQRAVLGVVAGEVGRALGRRDLMVLGSHVDESPAALVVVAKTEHEQGVREALLHTCNVLARSAAVDLDLIRRAAADIAAIRRRRSRG